MVVLRSREILPSQIIPKSLKERSTPEPLTPAQMNEPDTRFSSSSLTSNLENHQSVTDSVSSRRRSLRFASRSAPAGGCVENGSNKRRKGSRLRSVEQGNSTGDAIDDEAGRDVDANSLKSLGLRSGRRFVRRRVEYSINESILGIGRDIEDLNVNTEKNRSHKLLKKLVGEEKPNGELREEFMQKVIENAVNEMIEVIDEGKHKEVSDGFNVELKEKESVDECANSRGKKTEKEAVVVEEQDTPKTKRRYNRDEKGKGKLVEDDSASNIKDTSQLECKSKVERLVNDTLELIKDLADSVGDSLKLENGRQSNNSNSRKNVTRMEQFHDIARKNASRFAHFDLQEQEENLSPHVTVESPSAEETQEVEDWPGPFSTAMKIIRDRANKVNSQNGPSALQEAKSVPITWIPRKSQGSSTLRASPPSLQELCMRILAKNVDAITSLEYVPDAMRHKLCQLLCDCRSMNSCFLKLLLHGSPTEVRIKDCSWLTEEDFLKYFQNCDTNNLSVLQLDQSGRCLPDYVLPPTLARSSKSMPALIALSLRGACRLTDNGLSSLLSSAPALRSINLSQCSLLTSTSIGTLSESLGSQLQELYVDDCQGLDAMLILPALKKLEHLEVLSLAGVQTVCDAFVREFVIACGHNMKELVLTDCVKLTDSSMKFIAERCPRLCALDLVNLRKLTDSALGYLANGCQEIQTLKLCRNSFSDEAIAAFLETSGEHLNELSLNNLIKVGNHTALSLARKSRNLLRLDLSWCRNLTNEAVGLIVDSCLSLRMLKLFGCGQITKVLLDGHSNPVVKIIGLKLSPVMENVRVPDSEEFPLRYSSVPFLL